MSKQAKSVLLTSVLIAMPAFAGDDARVTRLLEYVQTLDERITKLEAQLKAAGGSQVVSGSKIAVGGWTNPSVWRSIGRNTHERQVLATLGEPSFKEPASPYTRWVYEGTVNGKYLLGYVEFFQSQVRTVNPPSF